MTQEVVLSVAAIETLGAAVRWPARGDAAGRIIRDTSRINIRLLRLSIAAEICCDNGKIGSGAEFT
jgi:hypothetical protein